jgi:hypothetical protein
LREANERSAAWQSKSRDMALFRLAKAESTGPTHAECTLDLLGGGRHLQAEEAGRGMSIGDGCFKGGLWADSALIARFW